MGLFWHSERSLSSTYKHIRVPRGWPEEKRPSKLMTGIGVRELSYALNNSPRGTKRLRWCLCVVEQLLCTFPRRMWVKHAVIDLKVARWVVYVLQTVTRVCFNRALARIVRYVRGCDEMTR